MRQVVKSEKHLGYEYVVMLYLNEWIYNSGSWYCGYVKIPENNNLYGLRYSRDMPYHGLENETIESYFDVHGGITFAGRISDLNNDWFLGFDCNHHGDNPMIQDADYTERECKNLIDQIVALEEKEKSHEIQGN